MARPQSETSSSDALRQGMSAAADGQADGPGLERALQAWQVDAEARATWHTYHVIGDVLRNEELARPAQADEAFLHALRGRLAMEPRVLAPMPLPARASDSASHGRRWRWAAPAAAAAAFMGLASVLVVSRLGGPATGPALALAPASAPAALETGGAAALANGLVREADGRWVRRDERLDAYLRAHRDTSLANLPWAGGAVRSASTPLPANPGR